MPKILLLDNFDSFTYNLQDYLERLGAKCEVFRNNVELALIASNTYDGVVLSPGPSTPKEAGNLIQVLDFYHKQLPILGVCLGHQAIGEYFGATLTHAHAPMHGKISEICTKESFLFANLPSKFKVVRYHSLILKDLPSILRVTAFTNDSFQEVMALEHQNLPIFGVQFHPEAILCEYGLEILANWLKVL
ncbi:anthranilate synthase component II [Raineya orbicola]|jgi:anthranilate synthase component 2|uniref:Glutamine amidotransferase of anthranilate synthase or aminodeoxychorismate synthase n=1 Tax=Raineya orbicola TaxID=2016530 RepID=A0A2N3IHZ1_9BACT|nr:aminodeoxychorismate/anthranilate synthase component II [Raineya orbicola]PKQ69949.1 Glutamine amidotransferase of anthranilate synthase or aminodeoxychorismate synthase [Raineya orbicola]